MNIGFAVGMVKILKYFDKVFCKNKRIHKIEPYIFFKSSP